MAPEAHMSGTVTGQPTSLVTLYSLPCGRPMPTHPLHVHVAEAVVAPSEKETDSWMSYGMLNATVHEGAGPVQVEEVFTLAGVTTTGPWAFVIPTVIGHACPLVVLQAEKVLALRVIGTSAQATLTGSIVLPSESEMVLAGVPGGTDSEMAQLPLVSEVHVLEVTKVLGVVLTGPVGPATWRLKVQGPGQLEAE